MTNLPRREDRASSRLALDTPTVFPPSMGRSDWEEKPMPGPVYELLSIGAN